MASGHANARINMPNTDQIAGRVPANGVSTITGTTITSLVYRQDPNLQTMAAQMLGSSIGNEASQQINGVLAQRKRAEPEAKIPSEEHRERHVRELAHSQAAASERGQDLEEAPKRQTNARTAQHKARVSSNDMQSAQDKSASSSRSSTRKIMEYVEAFNEGVEDTAHDFAYMLAHPIDTVEGLAILGWDIENAAAELTFGITTEGAHQRNLERLAAIKNEAKGFVDGDGVAKTRILSHGISSIILGAATGGATGVAAKGLITRIPKIVKYGRFKFNSGELPTPKNAHINKVMQMIEEYMGPEMEVIKPGINGKSDLILVSKDKTIKIRFDIENSHGQEPHVNIEKHEPRNLYPDDPKMIQKENLHIYPKNDLEFYKNFTP